MTQEKDFTSKPDYCPIGRSRCPVCGWEGEYPVSGCPDCHASFTS